MNILYRESDGVLHHFGVINNLSRQRICPDSSALFMALKAGGRLKPVSLPPHSISLWDYSSLSQMLRKLIGSLGSPWLCRMIGPAPWGITFGKPMYSVVPRIVVLF